MTASASAGVAQSVLPAGGLRTEYLADPLGIDVEKPRLNWTLSGAARGEKQTACQVLVASSVAGLARNQGDLWDSGKTLSGDTAQGSTRESL